MYVCICAAVTERDVHAALAAGVETLDQLTMQLGVAAGCGCCRETAQRLMTEACGRCRECTQSCARPM